MVLPRSHGPRRPTIYDVAKLAGVSHQAVSRQLRGLSGVSPATGARIEAAAVELGYRPNQVARALATNSSRRIGALVFDLGEAGPAKIVEGAAAAARESGYVLDFISVEQNAPASIDAALKVLLDQDLAGIFAVGPSDVLNDRVHPDAFPIPVYFESEALDSPTDEPLSLNGRGAAIAMDALIRAGHRRIGHIAGPTAWASAENREIAYRRMVSERGLPELPVSRGDWSARSGYEAGLAWPLELGATALFVANDQMALGVLRALHERGIAIPGEMSVVGFDDIPEAEFMWPPLSTVRLDFVDQGRRRLLALIDEIEGRTPAPTTHVGRIELIERASIAAPAAIL